MDKIWDEINAKPRGPDFGAALHPRFPDRIPVVPIIQDATRRITRSELRQPACPSCGNNGPTHCTCEVTE